MSYTLKGRIESRLASAVPALIVALGLHTWWAVELVALMLAIGLALDVLVYHRVLAYQPGWAALPLGALELALVYSAMRWLEIMAPLRWALALYAVGWLAAQVCVHGLFPRARLEYGESGGELAAAVRSPGSRSQRSSSAGSGARMRLGPRRCTCTERCRDRS